MIHHLIRTVVEPQWSAGPPLNWVESEPNIYLYADDGSLAVLTDPDLVAANPSVIGSWDESGAEQIATDLEVYEAIRPLGNHPAREGHRGGDATEHLGYQHWLGYPRRELGSNNALYPDGNQPFAIETRHKYFEGTYAGWGWRAEIVGPASARDPSVRAIGVYSDPQCTQYQYTTGAFVQGPSDWQVDGEGNPLTVWHTETPAGFAVEPKPDWHLAVLWASIQEGYATLAADQESIQHLYWEQTQESPGETPGVWQDSGQTITGMVGAGTFNVSGDSSVFQAGEPMRIGDSDEVTFVREHAPGTIIIDPHVSNAVGKTIYLQRQVATVSVMAQPMNGDRVSVDPRTWEVHVTGNHGFLGSLRYEDDLEGLEDEVGPVIYNLIRGVAVEAGWSPPDDD